jgi:hypothetical protein
MKPRTMTLVVDAALLAAFAVSFATLLAVVVVS